MGDDRRNRDEEEPVPNEGVRLIGADEAAEARERDDVARRRGDDEPRPGDRPPSQRYEGPAPKLSFPLTNTSDADEIEHPPLADDVELPHWTEPATGEVPRAIRGDDDWEGDATDAEWSSFTGSSPRWRDSGSDYDDEDVSYLREDDDDRPGALDDTERPSESDFFSFDDLDQPAPSRRSVFAEVDDRDAGALDDARDPDDAGAEDDAGSRRVVIGSGADRESDPLVPDNGGRNLPQAIGVGLGFGAVALVCFAIGPVASLVLVLVVVTLASIEYFNALRRAGFDPATLLGIVATAAMVLAAYHRGEGAIAAVLFLTTAASLLWYFVGAGGRNPTLNIGVTLLGALWIATFGAFGGLMLAAPHGVGLLLGAVLAAVGYDVGGFFVGRNAGRAPLSAASPNKTWEGLIGGCVLAFVVAVAVAGRFAPWDSFGDAALLGVVALVAAPLGDLCQSLIKRDLGIKDMGTLLPGHGGLLDRIDSLLFVLPAVYYLARVSDFFV